MEDGGSFRRSFWIIAASILILLGAVLLVVHVSKPSADPFFRDAPDRKLSDQDIAAIAMLEHAPRWNPHPRLRLGTHRGLLVLDDHFCADICPDYTTSVIHYDVNAGPPCDNAGGVTIEKRVPESISVKARSFCLPLPLAIAECRTFLDQWERAGSTESLGWAKPDCSEKGLRLNKGVQ